MSPLRSRIKTIVPLGAALAALVCGRVVAEVSAVELDPFDPRAYLEAQAGEGESDPPFVLATTQPTEGGTPLRPPVRDPLRPPTRSPTRP